MITNWNNYSVSVGILLNRQIFCVFEFVNKSFILVFSVVFLYSSHSFSFILSLSVFIPELFVRHVISNSIICYLTRSSCFKFFFSILLVHVFFFFSQTDRNRICSNFGVHTHTHILNVNKCSELEKEEKINRLYISKLF